MSQVPHMRAPPGLHMSVPVHSAWYSPALVTETRAARAMRIVEKCMLMQLPGSFERLDGWWSCCCRKMDGKCPSGRR